MKSSNNSGYIALMTVIILGVVVSVVATSLVLLGLGYTRTSLSELKWASAKFAAEACTEDALRQIRLVPAFTGTGNLTLSNSTCSYTVSSSTTSSILSTGISGNSTHRIIVDLSSRTPVVTFTRWRDG
jgi:hypothetical protein